MNKLPTIITFYSEADACYIATFEQATHISGLGDTPQEALEELNTAYQACQEVAAEQGKNAINGGHISLLTKAAKMLNISELARESGINKATLQAKLQRGTSLKEDESAAVQKALKNKGIVILP